MERIRCRRWLGALVTGCVIMAVSACGGADPMRAYDITHEDQPTKLYKAAVADFVTAVQASDAAHLDELNATNRTAAGVQELLAHYGSASLTVTSYDFDHPGDAAVTLAVRCADGGRVTFSQAFIGVDGQWRPEIVGIQPTLPDNEPPDPDAAQSLPDPSTPAAPSTARTAVTHYDYYPPCSKATVAVPTS